MESTRLSRARSVSEPSLQVSCGNFLGDRSRRSNLVYEKGRDKIAHWIGSWGYEEVCAVLHQLVTRCRYNQMGYLWTALSSIPHRDFIYAATLSYSSESKEDLVPVRESSELGGVFFPLSTPITRDLSSRLRRSRRAENKRLHRISSVVDICDGLFSCTVMEESDNSHREEQFSPHIIFRPTTGEWNVSSKLPDIQTSHSKRDAKVCSKTIFHSTSVQPSVSQSVSMPVSRNQPTSVPLLSSLGPAYSHHTPPCQQPVPLSRSQPLTSYSTTPKLVSSRILQPMRRHMTTPIPGRPLLTPVASQPRPPTRQTVFAEAIQTLPLPPEGLECAVWFSNLQADWQQQEILELIISNLDTKELYYLSILLMSRQYRDIVSKLPETLAIRVLSFVPAKTLLSQCCQVCHSWNRRCSSPALWEIKTLQNRVCLPMKSFVSWKQYFLDDLRLKRNWVKGKRVSNSLVGHTKRVRSVCLKEELMVSGSTDCTVRVWNLATNECMSVLEGHTKAVWCVQFYGKNMVISGAGDGLIKIWNYRTSTCERTLEFHRGTVWAIQQKGELLVSGAHDKLVSVWDVRNCKQVRALEGHKGVVFAVDINDTTETVYSGAGDNTVREWSVSSGNCLRSIKVSRVEPVMSISWDKGILCVSHGKHIELWNTNTWEKLSTFRGHGDRVEAVQLKIYDASKPTGMVLSGSKDQTVKYWDITRGKSIRTLSVGYVISSCYSNSVYIVCGTSQDRVRVYDFHPHHVNTDRNRQPI